ncbi:MAG: right-handed parallel beta-helix repeat-containing protein [Sedimentisphaerales bacterium]|nr:right-handed parallel beta-helix repeat-containing protein [Sedimentisphaerales bacterium]
MYLPDSSHIRHVAKSGSDSNSGLAGQYPVDLANDAKLTISSAVSAAAAGDTIIVWPGDYAENVNFAGKALTLIGAGKSKSRIVPASGSGIVAADGSVVRNISVEALATGAKALDLFNKADIVVEDCDFYGAYGGLYGYGAENVFLRGCTIRGKLGACNFASAGKVVVEGCIFIADGTYSTSADCIALLGTGDGAYSNCVFTAQRDDTSDKAIGAAYCTSASRAVFRNCVFEAAGGGGHTGQAYGVLVNNPGAAAVLDNCAVKCSSDNASAGPYDLWQGDGKLVVCGCAYETAAGTITQGGSGWAGAVGSQVASALAQASLDKAAKVLVNKAVQNKLTGAIAYYDDDAEAVILTHTPTDSEAAITRTPS